MSLKTISIDGNEPISPDEAKRQLYIATSNSDNETELLGMITAARQYAENRTWRAIVEATYEYRLDAFPELIELPKPPAIIVSSVKYDDTDGVEQTVDASNYSVDTASEPARILRNSDFSWPATDNQIDSVRIRYKAGYDGTVNKLPGDMKAAMLMMVKHFFDNRDAVVVGKRSSIDAVEVPMSTNLLLDMYSLRLS